MPNVNHKSELKKIRNYSKNTTCNNDSVKSRIILVSVNLGWLIDARQLPQCQAQLAKELERVRHQSHGFQKLAHRALLGSNDLNRVGQFVLHVSQSQGSMNEGQ